MTFTEDLDLFLDEEEHAASATIAGVAGILGFFDDGHAETQNVLGTKPMFTCPAANLPAGLGIRGTVVIGEAGYEIVEFQPDGTGMMSLVLEQTW